jgi:hypothetical protein
MVRSQRFHWFTAAAALLALLTTVPARADDSAGPARLFLYSSASQSAATELMGPQATFSWQQAYNPGSFGHWTHVVGCGSEIFFYSAYTGAAAVGSVDAIGAFTTTAYRPGPYFAPGWDIVTFHNGHLIFYDKESGRMVAGQMVNGAFVPVMGGFWNMAPGWTHIVSTGSWLMFYNKETGAGLVGDVRLSVQATGGGFGTFGGGSWFWIRTLPSFSRGWTHITNTGNGMLFYSADTGVDVMVDVDSNGIATTRPYSSRTIAPGYTSIVAGNQGVLFYNRVSGDIAVGSLGLLSLGGALSMRTYPASFPTGWTHIVTYVLVAPLF